MEGLGGLACEDCGQSLAKGSAKAAPLAVSPEDHRISRIDILCETCVAERTKDPIQH